MYQLLGGYEISRTIADLDEVVMWQCAPRIPSTVLTRRLAIQPVLGWPRGIHRRHAATGREARVCMGRPNIRRRGASASSVSPVIVI